MNTRLVAEVQRHAGPAAPLLRRLQQYWDEVRGARAVPRRADIDPMRIPALLPRIILIDVLRDPLDFRYRLMGEYVVAMNGRSLVGQKISDLIKTDPNQQGVFDLYRDATETRSPLFLQVRYPAVSGAVKSMEVAVLPLSEDGATVGKLIAGVEYAGEPPRK